jgi:hypothetical protein
MRFYLLDRTHPVRSRSKRSLFKERHMTHANNTSRDLTEQELDSVSGGVRIEIGPVHMRFDPGSFGIGVGNMGAWISSDGIGWHVGNSGGHIG